MFEKVRSFFAKLAFLGQTALFCNLRKRKLLFSLQSVYCTRYTIIQKIIQNLQLVIRITCYTKMPLLYELCGESFFSQSFTSILP